MPREALRRLDQACAVRRVASNASTSIAVVLYRARTSRPRHNKLELFQAFESLADIVITTSARDSKARRTTTSWSYSRGAHRKTGRQKCDCMQTARTAGRSLALQMMMMMFMMMMFITRALSLETKALVINIIIIICRASDLRPAQFALQRVSISQRMLMAAALELCRLWNCASVPRPARGLVMAHAGAVYTLNPLPLPRRLRQRSSVCPRPHQQALLQQL